MSLGREALRALERRDPVLGATMRRLPGWPGFPDPVRSRQTHFEALGRAIVYQQLAGKAAATIHGRVCALTQGPRLPKPEELLRLPERKLRGAGLSANKMAALLDLAGRIADGRLRTRGLGRLPDDEVVERLVEVRGIGVWTAQMFLMFKLGRLDVLPIGDLGVQEGARRLDGLEARPSPQELEERGEVWGPLRSVASWYLWRLADEPSETT